MTLGQTYRAGRRILEEAGNETSAFDEAFAFDASALFFKAFGLDRQQRILRSAEPAEKDKAETYLSFVRERAEGRPLQYILGKWPFLGLELEVGEGVLIPREETELLVKTAARLLRDIPEPRVADLCSGSGAAALGIVSLLPGARVTAAEKEEAAFRYLVKNIQKTGLCAKPVLLDVLNPEAAEGFSGIDCVVSNPPYVKSGDLPLLQREVRREPAEALDGGEDGLLFYRAIARNWVPALRPGGVLAVEVGDGQAESVASLFTEAGIESINSEKDFSGIPRVVSGRKAGALFR